MWCLLPSSLGPAPRPSGGGLRARLVLEAQLGSPVGPGSCFSVVFFFCPHPLHSLDSRRAGFRRVSGRGPTLAGLHLSGFCPEVPPFRASEDVHPFTYSSPTVCQVLAAETKEVEPVSMPTVGCI